MNGLFRFPDAIKRDPTIELWLEERPPELGAVARAWFQRMRESGPDVREVMHDGCPTACVDDAAEVVFGDKSCAARRFALDEKLRQRSSHRSRCLGQGP